MNYLESSSHHAVLFTHEKRSELSLSIWEDLKVKSIGHTFYNHTIIDIDTARKIESWANTPYHEEKIALISFYGITLQAQNALLKTFEEPRAGVKFILITTSKDNLIPTLLSRLDHVKHDERKSVNEYLVSAAQEFLQAPHKERLKLPSVVSILSAVDEENRKNREQVKAFIQTLGELLRTSHVKPNLITETLTVASYAGDSSSSGKALLEYLALLLPVLNSARRVA